jgi:hypothetical protein
MTSDNTLSEINSRLDRIEAQLATALGSGNMPGPLRLNDTEHRIVAAVRAKPLKGAAIARRLTINFSSNFKTTLAYLVRMGVLGKGRGGYFAKDADPGSFPPGREGG